MNFWKEALVTAIFATLGETMFTKSKNLPETFIIIFGSTMIANHLINMEWTDRPKYGPENFIGPAENPAKKINPPNRV